VEHGFANKNEGTVYIRLKEESDEYRLEIADNGEGLRPGFNPAYDGSLGLQIVRTLVKDDLRGRFEMVQEDGVRSIIAFPKAKGEGRARRIVAEPDRLVPAASSAKREEEKRQNAAD
jgi:two-component sensor histidine kinase